MPIKKKKTILRRVTGLTGGKQGFSLVEVTLAMGLFAFAILPIIALFSTGLGTMRDSMDETVMTGIAREIFSEAQREDWNNLPARFANETFFYTDEGVRTDTQAEANGGFVAEVTLADPPALLGADTDTARLLQVTVRHFADTNNRMTRSELLVNTLPR